MSKDSVLDALSKLMEKTMLITDCDRDLIIMQNIFQLKTPNNLIFNKIYDLNVFGGHNKTEYTATSILVGLPAAIIAQVSKINNIDDARWRYKRDRLTYT